MYDIDAPFPQKNLGASKNKNLVITQVKVMKLMHPTNTTSLKVTWEKLPEDYILPDDPVVMGF